MIAPGSDPTRLPLPARSIDRVGAVLFVGFGAAVTMWCVWFLTHLPGLGCPPAVVGVLLLVVLFSWCVRGGSCFARRDALLVTAGAGMLSGIINLLLLGSLLVKQPQSGAPEPGFEGLAPGAPVAAAGFLGASLVIGLLGGLVGSSLAGERGAMTRRDWLANFGVLTAISIVPLILLGGLVTSADAGMSVPGWPDSYGANMFLFPISLMTRNTRVMFEHSHRLFGSLVGLSTIALFLFTLVADRRGRVKVWAGVLLLAVIIQGLLGGLRVIENKAVLAMFHGVAAQAIFALAVALAAMLTATFRSSSPPVPHASSGRLRRFTVALIVAMFIQIALGATYRHLGQRHALYSHAAFSIVVLILAQIVGYRLGAIGKETGQVMLRRTGKALAHSVGLQFLLGFVTLWVVLSAANRGAPPTADQLATAPAVPPHEALVATAHQAFGAVILALATLAAVWTRRLLTAKAPSA